MVLYGAVPGPVQDVTGAETLALLVALQHAMPPLTIYSDCAAVLANIARGRAWATRAASKHAGLWCAIFTLLDDFGPQVVVRKSRPTPRRPRRPAEVWLPTCEWGTSWRTSGQKQERTAPRQQAGRLPADAARPLGAANPEVPGANHGPTRSRWDAQGLYGHQGAPDQGASRATETPAQAGGHAPDAPRAHLGRPQGRGRAPARPPHVVSTRRR